MPCTVGIFKKTKGKYEMINILFRDSKKKANDPFVICSPSDQSHVWTYAKRCLLSAISRHQQQLIHVYCTHVLTESFLLKVDQNISINHPIKRILYYFTKHIYHDSMLGRIAVFSEQSKSTTYDFTPFTPEQMINTLSRNYFQFNYEKFSFMKFNRELDLTFHKYGQVVYDHIYNYLHQVLSEYHIDSKSITEDKEWQNLAKSLK